MVFYKKRQKKGTKNPYFSRCSAAILYLCIIYQILPLLQFIIDTKTKHSKLSLSKLKQRYFKRKTMSPKLEKDNYSMPQLAASTALVFMMICLIIYILHVGRAILIPFVVAIFFWYLINAAARALNKISIFGMFVPRFWCFAATILLFCCGLWIMTDLLARNVSNIMAAAPIYQENFEKVSQKLMTLFDLTHTPTVRDLLNYIDIKSTMKTIAGMLTGLAGKTLIVAFYVGFLLYEQRFFDRKIVNMIEDKRAENRVRQALANIDSKMQRYIGVKSLVAIIDTSVTFCILTFFKVDFAAFLAMLAFFLHFIPYAGSVLAIGIPSTIALIHTGDLNHAVMVAIALSVLGAFLGHFLDPFLMGDKLNLSPIFIISSLTMWGMVWGIPGMFLAVPILSMIMITLAQFPYTRPFSIMISKTGEISQFEESEAKN